jgi:hypothetical protein
LVYLDLGGVPIKKEVAAATATWRIEAAKLKIKKAEIERMASAFKHEDLHKAISG